MEDIYSDRIRDVPRSFIREILKVTLDPTVISFAGGLPNRTLFPVDEIKEAANKVLEVHGRDVLQYGDSEGDVRLREYIAARYLEKYDLQIPVEHILVTSGSQQALDLLGKVLLNEGDKLVIEEPGYLGAIQAFSLNRVQFLPVPVSAEGMDTEKLASVISTDRPKLVYTVPNFQNPSGISYTLENRQTLATILEGTNTILIEDDPYGDLRFAGEPKPSLRKYLPGNTVLLGSFSKILAPGLRLGWIAANGSLIKQLVTAKQATDLHTSNFTQSIVVQYLSDNDVKKHIADICHAYGQQCEAMLASMERHFPPGVSHTRPEGGMFLWAQLPPGIVALDLFDLAIKDKVAFVPGDPFYVRGSRHNTLRLNFSCSDVKTIEVGIKRLGKSIRRMGGNGAELGLPGVRT